MMGVSVWIMMIELSGSGAGNSRDQTEAEHLCIPPNSCFLFSCFPQIGMSTHCLGDIGVSWGVTKRNGLSPSLNCTRVHLYHPVLYG
eukprot:1218705-Rhodomonas_salina.1